VPWAAVASEIEAFARRPERQNLFALGQRFEQMIFRFVGGAFGAVGVAEQTGELALAHVFQRAAHVEATVDSSVGSGENGTALVFCGHGASDAGSCPGGGKGGEWARVARPKRGDS